MNKYNKNGVTPQKTTLAEVCGLFVPVSIVAVLYVITWGMEHGDSWIMMIENGMNWVRNFLSK